LLKSPATVVPTPTPVEVNKVDIPASAVVATPTTTDTTWLLEVLKEFANKVTAFDFPDSLL
jgi:hypothetical protein